MTMRNPFALFMVAILAAGYVSLPSMAYGDTSIIDANRKHEIERIFRVYQYEKSLCPKVVDLLRTDGQFVKEFSSYKMRSAKGRNNLIVRSAVSETPEIRYLLDHQDYMVVDYDHHGGPGYVYMKDEAIFCAQTVRRLEEIEGFGPSEMGWRIREDFFGNFLTEMHNPLIAAMEPRVTIDEIFNFIVVTKNIYSSDSYRDRIGKLVTRTVTKVEMEISAAQEASDADVGSFYCIGCAVDEQRRVAGREKQKYAEHLKAWIAKLEQIR